MREMSGEPIATCFAVWVIPMGSNSSMSVCRGDSPLRHLRQLYLHCPWIAEDFQVPF